MAEINLLPDELRGKENKELEVVRKTAREGKIEMTVPSKFKPPAAVRVSFFSRLSGGPKPKKESLKSELPGAVPILPVKDWPKPLLPANKPKLLLPAEPPKPKSSFFGGYSGFKLPVPKPFIPPMPPPAKPVPKIEVPAPSPVIKKEPEKIIPILPLPPMKIMPAAKPAAEKIKKTGWFQRLIRRPKGSLAVKRNDPPAKSKIKPAKAEKFSFLDVNLMPTDLAGQSESNVSKKFIISGLLIVITLLALVGTYLGLTWYQIKVTQQNQQRRDLIAALDQKIAQAKDESLAAFALQAKLISIRQLLDKHIYWTKFFSDLEKYTLPDVYYTNFSMSGQDKLVISALGRDYNSVAGQLAVFQQAKDFVKTVSINSAAATLDKDNNYAGVSFNINLEFMSGIFNQLIE